MQGRTAVWGQRSQCAPLQPRAGHCAPKAITGVSPATQGQGTRYLFSLPPLVWQVPVMRNLGRPWRKASTGTRRQAWKVEDGARVFLQLLFALLLSHGTCGRLCLLGPHQWRITQGLSGSVIQEDFYSTSPEGNAENK